MAGIWIWSIPVASCLTFDFIPGIQSRIAIYIWYTFCMNNNFVSKSVRISNFQMAVKTKPSHGLGWKLEKWRDNWLRPIWPFIKKNQKSITTWSNLQLKIGNFVKLVILHGKLLKIGITKNEIPTSLGFSCSSPIRIILTFFFSAYS